MEQTKTTQARAVGFAILAAALYALNAPLILTDNSKPTAAVTYATGAGIKSGYVLGGTGLISDKVVKNIFSKTCESWMENGSNAPSKKLSSCSSVALFWSTASFTPK